MIESQNPDSYLSNQSYYRYQKFSEYDWPTCLNIWPISYLLTQSSNATIFPDVVLTRATHKKQGSSSTKSVWSRMLVPVFLQIEFWLWKTSLQPVFGFEMAFTEIYISSSVKSCNIWFLCRPYLTVWRKLFNIKQMCEFILPDIL